MCEHGHVARFAEAFELAVPLAEAGWVPAQGVAGHCCVFAPNVKTDVERALFWLEKAAGAGFAQSCSDLATLYGSGAAGRRDFELASRYGERAVRFGFPKELPWRAT